VASRSATNQENFSSYSAFKQQRLNAWQPVMTPQVVILGFLIVGILFAPVGVVLLSSSNTVVEVISPSYEECPSTYVSDGTPLCDIGPTQCPCISVTFTNLDMQGPVNMYYQIENFYQNHRDYVKSRCDSQLNGNADPGSSSLSSCDPYTYYNSSDPSTVYLPCGLVANTMFTDTFTLVAETIVNGSIVESPVQMSMEKISWPSDLDTKFNNPPLSAAGIRTIADFKHPDFVNWMRTAAFPNFRKLYRIIPGNLVGNYTVYIHNTYNVTPYAGHKYVVLSTSSWLGGKNPYLGYVYIIVGALSLFSALVIGIKQYVKPRIVGDTSSFEYI